MAVRGRLTPKPDNNETSYQPGIKSRPSRSNSLFGCRGGNARGYYQTAPLPRNGRPLCGDLGKTAPAGETAGTFLRGGVGTFLAAGRSGRLDEAAASSARNVPTPGPAGVRRGRVFAEVAYGSGPPRGDPVVGRSRNIALRCCPEPGPGSYGSARWRGGWRWSGS